LHFGIFWIKTAKASVNLFFIAKSIQKKRRRAKEEPGMKLDTVYKKAFNDVLQHVETFELASPLESENVLANKFEVSRTTIRKILVAMRERRILGLDGSKHRVASLPTIQDYFPASETTPTFDRVEKRFMEWMLRGNVKPGDYINGLELARQFNVSPSGVREYLNRFSRFRLIEKRPNSGWVFHGFTTGFALELMQVRELFEMSSARIFATLPKTSDSWNRLENIAREHRWLLENIQSRYQDFSDLDERFHRLVNDASSNRFFVGFYDIISLIFHYHYQWNKIDERERNITAIREHIAYIDALFSGDLARIERACGQHMESARKTLLTSIASATPIAETSPNASPHGQSRRLERTAVSRR
jgi:DNA-binding GntR family transcriptional regulator